MKYKVGYGYVSSLEKNGTVNIPDGAICITIEHTELGYLIFWLEPYDWIED